MLDTDFYDLMRRSTDRNGPCEFSYQALLFDSWNMEVTDIPIDKWINVHAETDAQSEECSLRARLNQKMKQKR